VEGYNIHIIYMIIYIQLFFETKNQCCFLIGLFTIYVIWKKKKKPFKPYCWNGLSKKNSNAFSINLLDFSLKTYMCENLEIHIDWILFFFIWRKFEKDNND
jgi:hypothetical protein